jgi:hypothetical protein
MQRILTQRKIPVPPADKIGLAEVGRTILWALGGAVVGVAAGLIYASPVTALFGAIGGSVAGLIVHEVRRERQT